MKPPKNTVSDAPPFRKCKLFHYDYNPEKTWLIEFYQWNTKTQSKHRRFFSRFNSIRDPKQRLKEANRWIAFIDQQLEQGAVFEPEPIPEAPKPVVLAPMLLDDLKAYLIVKESTLAETAFKVYRNFGNKLKVFLIEKGIEQIATKEFNPECCDQYRQYILKLHSHPTTRNKELNQLKTFFLYFTKAGRRRFDISPAADVELVPKQESQIHEPYTDEQATAIFERITSLEDYPLLLFIYFVHYCFARPGQEVRLMKVRDLKERSVTIRPGRSKTNITKSPTLPKPLNDLIDDLKIRDCQLDFYVFGKNGKPGPEPVGKNYFYHRHKKILNELGLEGKYTVYGWKHTGNIKAIRLGIHPKKLQVQNGFTEYRTMEIYTRRLSAFADDEIYEKFV